MHRPVKPIRFSGGIPCTYGPGQVKGAKACLLEASPREGWFTEHAFDIGIIARLLDRHRGPHYRLNLGYLDPAKIKIKEWENREDVGILYVPKAGENLYRLK